MESPSIVAQKEVLGLGKVAYAYESHIRNLLECDLGQVT